MGGAECDDGSDWIGGAYFPRHHTIDAKVVWEKPPRGQQQAIFKVVDYLRMIKIIFL
jgi:hypothetical protein